MQRNQHRTSEPRIWNNPVAKSNPKLSFKQLKRNGWYLVKKGFQTTFELKGLFFQHGGELEKCVDATSFGDFLNIRPKKSRRQKKINNDSAKKCDFRFLVSGSDLTLRSGGEESDESGGESHRPDVVDGGAEASEDVEGGQDEEGQEHGVVEEDGVGRRLVFGNLE